MIWPCAASIAKPHWTWPDDCRTRGVSVGVVLFGNVKGGRSAAVSESGGSCRAASHKQLMESEVSTASLWSVLRGVPDAPNLDGLLVDAVHGDVGMGVYKISRVPSMLSRCT